MTAGAIATCVRIPDNMCRVAGAIVVHSASQVAVGVRVVPVGADPTVTDFRAVEVEVAQGAVVSLPHVTARAVASRVGVSCHGTCVVAAVVWHSAGEVAVRVCVVPGCTTRAIVGTVEVVGTEIAGVSLPLVLTGAVTGTKDT